MPNELQVSIGQCSDPGRKKINQDFHGALVPKEPLLSSKGVALCLADGISSSDVSQYASEAAVTGFLNDYYSTSESWSVKTSVLRVLLAINSWLCSQTQNSPYRFNKERGYVCTFSTLVIKSSTAHLFHIGDTRIYRVLDRNLEQLTEDHRLWVSREKSYLSRALGIKQQLDIDYSAVALEAGDTFMLATDGIYEFVDEESVIHSIREHDNDLDQAANRIRQLAYDNGSDDNLSVLLIRIHSLPEQAVNEMVQQITTLPFPPELRPRMSFDGFEIQRELHASHRSRLYLATDSDTGEQVVIKIPSVDLREDRAYLERFMMEEWVARRINNAHVLKAAQQTRKRHYLYTVSEYIDGQTLKQWMIDHPEPDLESMRDIIEQIAAGLRAFHRQEMLHQDLRPENIMIDRTGTVKIIDFGSTAVAGLNEIVSSPAAGEILGTAQYSAPEYFIGEPGTSRSDLFSLGVIAYQMLSGRLPYGPAVARATTRAAQRRLRYNTVLDDERTIPQWVDETIKKAVHPDPYKRYGKLSEFVYDLRHPNRAFTNKTQPPLMERNPILFWKSLSLLLFILLIIALLSHPDIRF